jgi:uncharacterized protein
MTQSAQTIPADVASKYAELRAILRSALEGGLLVAFSGGVDSAFLLWAAEWERRDAGGRLVALTTESASLARAEREDAAGFAGSLGVEHRWAASGELGNPAYVRNDATRCFHCKTELFRICRDVSAELSLAHVAYGYNASDRGDIRPGHRAALDSGVLSPLDEAGLTKDDIRSLMRAFGLALADKPSSPCLSSRLMQGVPVTPEKLGDVEALEDVLRRGGLSVFRVRLHEEGPRRLLRVEVAEGEMDAALGLRRKLVDSARARGCHWVTLDLAGYRTGGATPLPPTA